MLIWNIKRIWKKTFSIKEGKENKQKIKFFLYSIIFGLIFSILFVYIFQEEPFTILYDGIVKTFDSDFKINNMLQKMVILGLAGIAVGIGFKAKIFNIGVSGQMIFGAMVSGLIALNLGSQIPNIFGQILIISISMFVSSIVAGICGLLKAYFRIHEVVSTILVNWIAFYFMKWMLDPNTSTLLDDSLTATRTISSNYLLRMDNDPTIPLIIILSIAASLTWIFIYKTRYGMLLKMTGLNPDASKYSGINIKLVTFYSLAFSGAIAGLLGAAIYFGIQDNFKVPLSNSIPIEGFNGIAIAIISYSNPFSIIIVSFIFSLIQSGIINTAQAIDSNFISLIFGILLYVTAINKIFAYLDFQKIFRKMFYSKQKNKLYENFIKEKEELDSSYYDEYVFSKIFYSNQKNNFYEIYLKEKEKLDYSIKNLRKKLNKSINVEKEKLKQKKIKIISKHYDEYKKLKTLYIEQKKSIVIQKEGK